ncbi:hypothetical protein DVH05_027840 [Phytophthora capsici]|nr:hypothetical protein DVH05_007176 [Phytophthora capsici]KAG1690791.1 hypothetical protein DVH05_027840 [Phytophthora capsici]|eukprot:jgi/Phyca11/553394/estExt2_Genewise1Plus.C_PHYCAscaffold_530044
MRLGYFLLATIVGFLACDNATASVSESTSSKLTAREEHPIHGRIGDFTAGHDNKRALRSEDEDGDADDSDDEERDLILSTIHRPKYWRWFKAGMTPYAVQQVLGLTGVRRLWKPFKRREYKGYVVFYTEQCHKPEYHDFCKKHADP